MSDIILNLPWPPRQTSDGYYLPPMYDFLINTLPSFRSVHLRHNPRDINILYTDSRGRSEGATTIRFITEDSNRYPMPNAPPSALQHVIVNHGRHHSLPTPEAAAAQQIRVRPSNNQRYPNGIFSIHISLVPTVPPQQLQAQPNAAQRDLPNSIDSVPVEYQ
ncbi:hypothetical protein RUND412_007072 [Rhizina undulata]